MSMFETLKSYRTNPIKRAPANIIRTGLKLFRDCLKLWSLQEGNNTFQKLLKTKLF